ncbi:hypothetical protein [Massilia sp. NR 4-1]|uniref:hypothetical protein n=1 Tax=Massilia sp. NR 4-1 TaxID=1678028 RepID=UPI00067DCBDE|nr:hypothetical protein [Massilia sp. NR 4-1]AKU20230.1 hypothetical protein ACZ75_00485 [Massilia sp. NR 4-1]
MLRRAILLLACLLCLHPARAQTPATAPDPLDTVAVYLVPTENFPEVFAANLARMLTRDTGIWVKASLAVPIAEMAPLAGSNQYAAEDFFEKLLPQTEKLPGVGRKTLFLLLTTRDLNTRSQNFRYQISYHNNLLNMSVISLARLFSYQDGQPLMDVTAATRFYKMCKRTIGEARLGWQRSGDPSDLMYAPIMSIEDLDKIGLEHKGAALAVPVQRVDQVSIATVDGAYQLTVPASTLTLSVPALGLSVQEKKGDAPPRSFAFSGQQGALSIAGSFESVHSFRGAGAAWDGDLSEMKAHGAPEASDAAFENIGGWNVVLYDQRGINSSSMRAHYVKDGTWIDLRLSLVKKEKPAARREALRQRLKAMAVGARNAGERTE